MTPQKCRMKKTCWWHLLALYITHVQPRNISSTFILLKCNIYDAKNLEVLRCDSCMITDPNKLFIEINSNYTTKSYHSYYWIHITRNTHFHISFIGRMVSKGISVNHDQTIVFFEQSAWQKQNRSIVNPIEIGHTFIVLLKTCLEAG